MLKFIFFFAFFAIGSNLELSNKLVSRTITVFTGYHLLNNITTGVKLTKRNNVLDFLWTEEFNETNSFKVYVNYFFANTGIREVITVDNVCATYKNDSIQYFLQLLILKGFANTSTCPIKKGSEATFRMPFVYSYMTRNHACGPTFAMYNVFKLNPKNPHITPALFVATFTGHITGPKCYPDAKFNHHI